jgi:putative FmdB family regulatory protein
MPIYAYKCATCGHADDVMQKMSDDALTKCPACGAETYAKQVTAPNFALKGSGWYVTDFRGGDGGKKPPEGPAAAGGKPAAADASASPAAPAAKSPDAKTSPATAAPAAAAAPAAKSPPASTSSS